MVVTQIPRIVADFNTALSAAVSVAATTATIQSATDSDGVALSNGTYIFTIDGANSSKEYVIATLTGTTLSAIQSLSRQGAITSGFVRNHRVGSTVAVTDHGVLFQLVSVLRGVGTLDPTNPLQYDSHPTFTSNTQIIDKKYADDLAIAGAPDANTTTKGLVEEATQAEVDARTVAGGTGAKLFAPLDKIRATKYYDGLTSGGSANAYTLTVVPAATAYIVGQEFSFIANFANTGVATLNVSGLGAKTIKKLDGVTDLVSGDITNGQAVKVQYDGTNMQMLSPVGGAYSAKDGSAITNVRAVANEKAHTFGETITAGQPLYLTQYATNAAGYDTGATFHTVSSSSFGNAFTIASNPNRMLFIAITCDQARTITGVTYNGVAITQLVSNNSADGSYKYTIGYLLNPASGANTLTVTTDAASSISISVYSYFNIEQQAPEVSTNASGTNNAAITAITVPLTNRTLLVSTITVRQAATVGGTAWSTHVQTPTSGFRTADNMEVTPIASRTVTATADSSGFQTNVWTYTFAVVSASATARAYITSAAQSQTSVGFVGFAAESGSAAQSKKITIGGCDANQTSLVAGKRYYLSNTLGAIGTTAGTTKVQVGVTLSATEIDIQKQLADSLL